MAARNNGTSAPVADVCFVVEGSYPYVTGGVASWVHQLITNLPELSFALLTLLPDEKFSREDRYAVPDNVIARQDVFLFGENQDTGDRREADPGLVEALHALHAAPLAARCPYFRAVEGLLRSGKHTSVSLLTSHASWQLLQALYLGRERRISFLDYFWTWRAIHGPMFRLFDVPLPRARVYHPVSTGYAGFLAALAKLRTGAGTILTEHGLYTREREIEIANARWIYHEPGEGTLYTPQNSFFKGWWRNQYRFLGQLTYDLCDVIATLHETNRRLQVMAGAADEKLVVVPNGIFPEQYAACRSARDWSNRPFQVGLIGRVVPIKDIKTFMRAIQLAARQVPLQAYVLGPTDEDPEYHRECLALAESLGLQAILTFTGKVDVKAYLARLDLNVLTSVSESQPLVILEASAAGVPTVGTDVGAVREMLEGKPGEDSLLGPSGLVTPVASPGATAHAIVELARSPVRYAEMAAAGLKRVESFYRQDDVFAFYRKTYRELAELNVPGPGGRKAGR